MNLYNVSLRVTLLEDLPTVMTTTLQMRIHNRLKDYESYYVVAKDAELAVEAVKRQVRIEVWLGVTSSVLISVNAVNRVDLISKECL